ncbi:TIGR03088 family PEP-CTERM/XrtA system glycosyltransferase [Rhodocyclaceae bacterium SMB388]
MREDHRPLVAHVVFSFRTGGLENGVVNLINRMPPDRFRHAIISLTDHDPDFAARVELDDVEYFDMHKAPGHGIALYPALYRLFRRLRPAIVHTRNLAALEAVVPAWVAGVPVRIHGEHGWDVSDPEGVSVKYRLMRRLYRPFVSRYVALSGHIERYLIDGVGIPDARVERICNGVDILRFRNRGPTRRRLDGSPFNDPGLLTIGTVGRLQPIKDQVNLVRAFALARDRGGADRLRLIIVGDGPLRAAVEVEIETQGIKECVWLAGERHDIPDIMSALDVFALPSRAEGISNTILEAMASGLPVVATAVGGNGELVQQGETGLLVPPSDSPSLANALLTYANDPERAARHGAAGRHRAESMFSLDGMVDTYANMYEDLLHDGRHARGHRQAVDPSMR